MSYEQYEDKEQMIKRWTRMQEAQLRAKQDEYDRLAEEIAYGPQQYRRKKKKPKRKPVKIKKKRKRKIGKQKHRYDGQPMGEETYEKEEMPSEPKIIYVDKETMRPVDTRTQRAIDVMRKTGQLTKKYGGAGIRLTKRQIGNVRNLPSKIDETSERRLKALEEKYGPIEVRYVPEKGVEIEGEQYGRSKKKKHKAKKRYKRKVAKKKKINKRKNRK